MNKSVFDVQFVAPAQATLSAAAASFHTNDDDKDNDTTLVITLEKDHNQFAKSETIVGDTFHDHRNQGPFPLRVQGVISKQDVQGATSTITIQPNGNDT
jgi:hypothetical protein